MESDKEIAALLRQIEGMKREHDRLIEMGREVEAENARLQERVEEAERQVEEQAQAAIKHIDDHLEAECVWCSSPHKAMAEVRKKALEKCQQLATDRIRTADAAVKKDIYAADALMGIATIARDAIEEDDPHYRCPANAACGQFGDEPCLAPRGKA